MLATVKKRISLKITLTLVVCLVVIFGLLSWYLIESRKQVLEQELFAKGRLAALVGAHTFSHFLEELVDDRTLTLDQIFDENYQLITEGALAGSKIPKYHTSYDRFLDQWIQDIEDTFLLDNMVVYAVLIDRNGYLPTHNRRYSKSLSGNPELDRVNNRTKRIFDDPVAIAAARHGADAPDTVFKQVSYRDTGTPIWDISAPVFIKGKHWGAFRIGFSIEEVEASMAQLQRTIILASLGALISLALLTMYLVSKFTRPLKFLTRSAQAIAAGRRKEKIALQSSDEVGVLVEAFNLMSDTLEQTTVSRDFYDKLVQSMYDLLIVADPQGKVVSVNQATCDVLGFNEEHLRKQLVQDLVELRDGRPDWFSGQAAARQNFTADVVLTGYGGAQVPMAMSCSPMDDADSHVSGFILIFQDNRERLKAQQAKEQALEKAFSLNQELEAKNLELAEAYRQLQNSHMQVLQQEKMASIGQLAAGVAHEINNPLGFINSNLGTLGKYFERLKKFLAHQQRLIGEKVNTEDRQEIEAEWKKLKIEYLLADSSDLISESLDGADRVKVIVKNLKSFSRLDQEQEQDADINQCLESTLSIAWNELKYKVTLEKDFGPLPLLHCYPQKLNQVFMNLLLNAVQAIEKLGIIKIRTWQAQNDIFVEISDTGCGIPAENLNRIFEPFFTTKEVGKGTGLGMSISYEIINEHGGEIRVASTVGEGTVFTIRLPLIKRIRLPKKVTDDGKDADQFSATG